MRDQEFVDAADGTRLRLVRLGEGSPVVLVHGTAGGKGDWFEVARRLSESFEVITFDRRGRGDSGDGSEYSLTREVEDILAVIDVADAPVHLVGHSFGAILCMFAALRSGARVNALVLYEPPLGVERADGWLDGLDATIASGDLDSAIRKFAAAANITTAELGAIETSGPAWAALRDGVRAAGREIRAAKSALPFRKKGTPRHDHDTYPRSRWGRPESPQLHRCPRSPDATAGGNPDDGARPSSGHHVRGGRVRTCPPRVLRHHPLADGSSGRVDGSVWGLDLSWSDKSSHQTAGGGT